MGIDSCLGQTPARRQIIARRSPASSGTAGTAVDSTSPAATRIVLGPHQSQREGFTVVVEDCVGIGRAFGGGVVYPKVRPGELLPSSALLLACVGLGRRHGSGVGRGTEKSIRRSPCCLRGLHPGAHRQCRGCRMPAIAPARDSSGCRLIVRNFTQPEMWAVNPPGSCALRSQVPGRLHVDLRVAPSQGTH